MKAWSLLSLCFCVIVLGSIYTVGRKWQNVTKAPGVDGKPSSFHHPVYQVFWLFFGMALCLPVQKLSQCIRKSPAPRFSPFRMIIPSLCDVLATIFDSIGLIYTHVSVHQMLKGFIVIFAGLLSYVFFGRVLKRHQWFGILFIVAGTFIVGFSNFESHVEQSELAPNPYLGNALVLVGQLFLAVMFVYEEKILRSSTADEHVPVLSLVGWEGLWGIILSAIVVGVFFGIPGQDSGHLENFIQASVQIFHSWILITAFLVTTLVIGPFNYFGSMLTKKLSAVHRCTIDATRMFTVWSFSLAVRWEHFRWVQGVGYCCLLLGTLIHNEIIRIPGIYRETSMIQSDQIPVKSRANSKKRFCDIEEWLRITRHPLPASDPDETEPLVDEKKQ
eukprot:GILK01006241.1.p1 GENE.GILK01006241.1~~GILK01006241.1.p1  ORF type:complete len:388 (-),score=36.52 GILK01006241.1:205-1368(-)